MDRDLKHLEHEVITSMRTAIAHFDTDHSVVREQMREAHNLFADYSERWSEAFCTLYSEMLEIYCAYTPMPKGHYRLKYIGVGYSSFPVKTWVADQVQPPKPTAHELVARFDMLIQAWNVRSEEATRSSSDAECPHNSSVQSFSSCRV